jgi:hypothetical protein
VVPKSGRYTPVWFQLRDGRVFYGRYAAGAFQALECGLGRDVTLVEVSVDDVGFRRVASQIPREFLPVSGTAAGPRKAEPAAGSPIGEGEPDSPAIATTAGSPAGGERGKGSADGPKTLDDLKKTDWRLLRAMYALGAFDAETVRTRQQIVEKAGTGNHGSGHNKEAFAALQKLGLIKSRRRVGSWLTQAGRELIKSHQ